MIAWLVDEATAAWPFRRGIVATSAAAVIATLCFVSWRQTASWRDGESLWRHVVTLFPKSDFGHVGLGAALRDKGNFEEALWHSREAVRLHPENAGAFSELGNLLGGEEVDEAVLYWQAQLGRQPGNVDAHNNLGVMLVQKGRVNEAIEQWQQVLALDPANGNAQSNLAWVLATCPDDAIRNGARALELATNVFRLSGGMHPILFRTLAAAHAESGNFTQAIEIAQRGIQIANEQRNDVLARELGQQIELYRQHIAFRDLSIGRRPSP
jgi:tetratricopeptide (TPR) repeat protein